MARYQSPLAESATGRRFISGVVMDRSCILLVEDEEHDVFFMRRAFDAVGVGVQLHAVSDGQEAMDYLEGKGEYADRLRFPLPCLLVTDIKMPKVDGFDLLAWLQTQARFRDLPRIVISSSCHEADLERSLDLGANAYFIKPSRHKKLIELVREWQHRFIAGHCLRAA